MNLFSKILTLCAAALVLSATSCMDSATSSSTVNAANNAGLGNVKVYGTAQTILGIVDANGNQVTDIKTLQAVTMASGGDPNKTVNVPGCTGCHMGPYTQTTYTTVIIDFNNSDGKGVGSKTYDPPVGFDPNTDAGKAWLQAQVDDYFKNGAPASTPAGNSSSYPIATAQPLINSPSYPLHTPASTPLPPATPFVENPVKDVITQIIPGTITSGGGGGGGGYTPPR